MDQYRHLENAFISMEQVYPFLSHVSCLLCTISILDGECKVFVLPLRVCLLKYNTDD